MGKLARRSYEWKSCPGPSAAAALRREAPIVWLGNTIELALLL